MAREGAAEDDGGSCISAFGPDVGRREAGDRTEGRARFTARAAIGRRMGPDWVSRERRVCNGPSIGRVERGWAVDAVRRRLQAGYAVSDEQPVRRRVVVRQEP